MSATVRITIDTERAMEAFRKAHEVMERHVDGALEQGAQHIAREARRRVPTFHSNLLNSIMAEPLGARGWSPPQAADVLPPGVLAWQARTGENYARYVEEGVRPMRSHPPGIENGLLEWVRSRFAPENDKELSRIAFAVGFAIQRRGIKPRPYMAPAMEASEARVRQWMRQAVQAGIEEVFGGR